MSDEDHPIYAPFFGVMGAASAIIFSGEFQLFKFGLDVWSKRARIQEFTICKIKDNTIIERITLKNIL